VIETERERGRGTGRSGRHGGLHGGRPQREASVDREARGEPPPGDRAEHPPGIALTSTCTRQHDHVEREAAVARAHFACMCFFTRAFLLLFFYKLNSTRF